MFVHVQDLLRDVATPLQGIQDPRKVPICKIHIYTLSATTTHLTKQFATGVTITQVYDIQTFPFRSYQ